MRRAQCILLLISTCAWSQASSPGSADVLQRLELLEKRLQQSEQELAVRNRQLDDALKRIGQLETRLGEAPPVAPAVSAPETSMATEASAKPEDMDHTAMSMPLRGPRLNIRGYGDVGFGYTRSTGLAPVSNNSFALGQMDLYITSRLTNRLGVVMETVFEGDLDNSISVDVERFLLQYRQNKYFTAELGRYHSAIGYYNTAYHHSRWLQTAMDRPMLFAFEDAGGPLPVHNVGLTTSGRIPSGGLGLAYVAEVGNGRAFRNPSGEGVQNMLDDNRGKSLNFALSSRPDALPGLKLGTSFFIDRLSPAGAPSIQQRILAGYAVYTQGKVEFLNEVVWMRHSQTLPKVGERVTSIPGGYSQFSYRFGDFRPFARFEMLNPSAADPVAHQILMTSGLIRKVSTGLRYDFSDYAAFKVGFDRLTQRILPASNTVSAQLSFTF